ncbi:MAG: AAA family ATPase [Methylococcaceae bacterium]|nr:AAA family ATPase [Methylococcaceae bacterium]
MSSPGYNVFVMGEPGLGRLSMINARLAELSKKLPTPSSFAYVDNFSNQREPLAIQLPTGRGQQFCCDIECLIDL